MESLLPGFVTRGMTNFPIVKIPLLNKCFFRQMHNGIHVSQNVVLEPVANITDFVDRGKLLSSKLLSRVIPE